MMLLWCPTCWAADNRAPRAKRWMGGHDKLEKQVEKLDTIVRQCPVPITQYYGPAPRALCPCGSGRKARRCHMGEDLSWIAERPAALLTDARTGYANPGCYGRASKDCSEDLTREHYISDDLLESISWDGKAVLVRGAAWQPSGERKTVGVNSLSSRILCGRHNRALSPLDALAANFFRYSLEDHLDIFKYLGNDTRPNFPRGFHDGQRTADGAVAAEGNLGSDRVQSPERRRATGLPVSARGFHRAAGRDPLAWRRLADELGNVHPATPRP
ncbi:hypothetical protein SEA_MASK_3 [Mycobacterium phage Mask]|nr:hypothetical protein SEA_SEJANUS_3 [Mycobacterium phage Sejanus]UVT31536.1 hypothetical protein SEA_MASK_3 [Mycobacterium phage Mask]